MANLADTYQKKTDIEHILDAPDTYVGAIEADDTISWSFKKGSGELSYATCSWVPGLYKCFDEGIVNARDHYVRMQQKIQKGDSQCIPVRAIEIEVDRLFLSFPTENK